jgi:hypothetical protein
MHQAHASSLAMARAADILGETPLKTIILVPPKCLGAQNEQGVGPSFKSTWCCGNHPPPSVIKGKFGGLRRDPRETNSLQEIGPELACKNIGGQQVVDGLLIT